MSHCPNCKKKIAMSKAFCSRTCKEEYFHSIQIQIPQKFVMKNFIHNPDEEDRVKNFKAFADRHSWDFNLVIDKIYKEAVRSNYLAADHPGYLKWKEEVDKEGNTVYYWEKRD
ncbi:MAG: DUF2116 family Zn-ribbon domain-containing protein [Sulfurovum sp.]|jgi:hypothetical protein|nr:MAG: Uncharacterised protein [Arcobacter lacus]